MKIPCSHCKKLKDKEAFRPDKTRRSGLYPMCTECKSAAEEIWRNQNREIVKQKQRDYYRKNKVKIMEKRKEKYNPVKEKARYMAHSIPAQPCIICGGKAERHHPDYSQPLNVIFLCRSHHKKVHDGTVVLPTATRG